MKTILTFVMSLSICSLFGQDTIYFNDNWEKVNSLEQADYYEVLKYDKVDSNKVVIEEFYLSGQIRTQKHLYPYSKYVLHGKRKQWYETGKLKMELDYMNGKLHGQVITYWDDGQIKRKDIHDEGKLIEGHVWNKEGKEVKYYDFLIMPKFQNGIADMTKYLTSKLKYPKESRRRGIEGNVLIRFIVERNGKVSNVKVIKSVDEALDNEAIRVIKNFPKWEPGIEDGEKIRVRFNMPIVFKLTSSEKPKHLQRQ